jgi:glutamate carboxypeptidase
MARIPEGIDLLVRHAGPMQDQLIAWCGQNTGSRNLAGLERMADMLFSACREITPLVDLVPVGSDGRMAVRAYCRPEAERRVLLSGHYDTVFSDVQPFQSCGLTADGRLRGPGVADMKGGIMVLLEALRAFEDTPGADSIGWEVLLTPDEEIGSVVSRPLIEDAARNADLGLVFEAARENGDIVVARKGAGVATATSRGRASHAAAAPSEGRNAILALSEFILDVRRLPDEMPDVLLNVGQVRGGGPLNVVPDFAEAGLDVRIGAAVSADAVAMRLREAARAAGGRHGCQVNVALEFRTMPLEPRARTGRLLADWQGCARDLGLAPFSGAAVGGSSDANLLFAAGLPCLDGLGPVGGAFHTDREWIEPATLVSRAQIAALFLHRFATGLAGH